MTRIHFEGTPGSGSLGLSVDKHCSLEMWTKEKILRTLGHVPILAEVTAYLEAIPSDLLKTIDLSHSFQVDPNTPDLLPNYEYKPAGWREWPPLMVHKKL
jgi:hypothetical protein